MGNDYWISQELMGKYNLAKYCSYGLNANIDPLVDHVEVLHTPAGVDNVSAEVAGDGLEVRVAGGVAEFSAPADVYRASGEVVAIGVSSVMLAGGIYIARGGDAAVKFAVK